MSFLTTVPELLQAAAGQLQAIGSAVAAANSTAAFSITGVVPAAADEVSAMTAAAFAGYGQQYQAISAEASMIHEEFVKALGLSADSYSATEAANATQAAGGHLPPAHMAPVARRPRRRGSRLAAGGDAPRSGLARGRQLRRPHDAAARRLCQCRLWPPPGPVRARRLRRAPRGPGRAPFARADDAPAARRARGTGPSGAARAGRTSEHCCRAAYFAFAGSTDGARRARRASERGGRPARVAFAAGADSAPPPDAARGCPAPAGRARRAREPGLQRCCRPQALAGTGIAIHAKGKEHSWISVRCPRRSIPG